MAQEEPIMAGKAWWSISLPLPASQESEEDKWPGLMHP